MSFYCFFFYRFSQSSFSFFTFVFSFIYGLVAAPYDPGCYGVLRQITQSLLERRLETKTSEEESDTEIRKPAQYSETITLSKLVDALKHLFQVEGRLGIRTLVHQFPQPQWFHDHAAMANSPQEDGVDAFSQNGSNIKRYCDHNKLKYYRQWEVN